MFYSYNITVTHGTDEATAEVTKLKLSPGIIHQVAFIFPVNSNREIYVKLLHASHQVIPSNPEDSVRANNTVISTREFYELKPGSNLLTVNAWNTHATDDFLFSVNIGILPRAVLQPFSFKELLAAALGLEEEEEE